MNKALEKILLIRIQQGKDPKAFEHLYDKMADPIYRFIYFKVSNVEVAQDLTSDVFLKLWENLVHKDAQVKFLKAYIYIIARSAVIDHYRSSKAKRTTQLSEAMNLEADGFEEKLDIKLEAESVVKLISQLKDSYQEILILRHVNQLSLKEIARIIEKTPVATRVQLHRAQQALKREYEKASK